MKAKHLVVADVLKETKQREFLLEVYTDLGYLIGVIGNEEEKRFEIQNLRVRKDDYYIDKIRNRVVISIHEQDNMPYIRLLYRIIADWKYTIWEEHGH